MKTGICIVSGNPDLSGPKPTSKEWKLASDAGQKAAHRIGPKPTSKEWKPPIVKIERLWEPSPKPTSKEWKQIKTRTSTGRALVRSLPRRNENYVPRYCMLLR